MIRPPRSPDRRKSLGQSLVEVAITLPLLLIMLSGLIEFGFALNQFLDILDAAREGARFGSDGDPILRASCLDGDDDDQDKSVSDCPPNPLGANSLPDDTLDCAQTTDYYMQVACVAQNSLTTTLTLDPQSDDIIISIYRVYKDPTPVDGDDSGIIGQLPDYSRDPDLTAHDPISTSARIHGQWRLYGNHTSVFSLADVQTRLDSQAPGAGVLIVEVYYDYHHILGLPWITAFVPNPLTLHSFTIIPVPAVEPRPTPTPTPTFTPTPTSTNTFTPTPSDTPTLAASDTPTPSQTPTPSDTPTETASPVGCGFADPDNSTLTASPTTQWADGETAITVIVTVIDNCELPLSGQAIELTSSRPSEDDIELLFQSGNQATFTVKSSTLGLATLTATLNPASASPVTLTTQPLVTFVCLNGAGSSLSFNAQQVQFAFSNPQNPPMPATKLLRTLTITWDDQSDARRLVSVTMGATVIWSSAGVTSPHTINVGDWISAARNISPGASKSLVLTFNVSSLGGTYTLDPVEWDDGSGAGLCTSAAVSATR